MDAKLLTNTELTTRLQQAQERVRRARATEARLRRQLAVTDRRLAAQIKITLGAALLRAAEHEPRAVEGLRRLLAPHITRETDVACLRDTVFAISASAAVTATDQTGEEA